MSDLVGNPEDRFSRVTAHQCSTNVHMFTILNSCPGILLGVIIIVEDMYYTKVE